MFQVEKNRNKLLVSIDRSIERLHRATKVSMTTLKRLTRNEKSQMGDSTIADIDLNKSVVKNGKIDTFTKDIIRRTAISMMNLNKCVTLRTLKHELEEKDVTMSKFILMKTLHELGFRYGKLNGVGRKGLYERKDISLKRIDYLRKITAARNMNREIVFLDETWIDSNSYSDRQWIASQNDEHLIKRTLPINKGKRFIVLHAGSDKGWIPNCQLVFRSKTTDCEYKTMSTI